MDETDEKPADPTFPLDDTSYGGFFANERAKMKAWFRKELALHTAGKSEDERAAENP